MKPEKNPEPVKGKKAENLIQHNSSYEELWFRKAKSDLIPESEPLHVV